MVCPLPSLFFPHMPPVQEWDQTDITSKGKRLYHASRHENAAKRTKSDYQGRKISRKI